MSQDEVKNKLKTLTQGSKGDKVIDSMARTFKTLCEYADWSEAPVPINKDNDFPTENKDEDISPNYVAQNAVPVSDKKLSSNQLELNYNIQIHLPETTNMAVYDAIFQSIKKHLM